MYLTRRIDSGPGAVVVYSSSTARSQLTEETVLRADDGELNDCFGISIAQYGYNAVIGTMNTGMIG